MEVEGGVLIIRRIHAKLTLKADPAHWEAAQRVHGFFADKCPVYLTLKNSIAITTELILEPAP